MDRKYFANSNNFWIKISIIFTPKKKLFELLARFGYVPLYMIILELSVYYIIDICCVQHVGLFRAYAQLRHSEPALH